MSPTDTSIILEGCMVNRTYMQSYTSFYIYIHIHTPLCTHYITMTSHHSLPGRGDPRAMRGIRHPGSLRLPASWGGDHGGGDGKTWHEMVGSFGSTLWMDMILKSILKSIMNYDELWWTMMNYEHDQHLKVETCQEISSFGFGSS
jgi:hypothetical protein